MKSPINKKLLFLFTLVFSYLTVCAQTWEDFNDKEKAAQMADSKRDYATAAKLCCDIINMNNNTTGLSIVAYAFFTLGHYYLHGHYYSIDVNQAIQYFEKASELKYLHGQAELYLATIYNSDYYKVKDLDKSFQWIEKGAERCSTIEYLLAEIYELGYTNFLTNDSTGVFNVKHRSKTVLNFPNIKKDLKKAYEHYYNYFERNSCFVRPLRFDEYDLAVALMDSIYLEVDYTKAYEYLRRFAPSLSDLETQTYNDSKTADALWRLSILYRFGLGTTDNEERANTFLKYAASCGSKKAQDALKELGLP